MFLTHNTSACNTSSHIINRHNRLLFLYFWLCGSLTALESRGAFLTAVLQQQTSGFIADPSKKCLEWIQSQPSQLIWDTSMLSLSFQGVDHYIFHQTGGEFKEIVTNKPIPNQYKIATYYYFSFVFFLDQLACVQNVIK